MNNWYIKSTNSDQSYLDMVESIASPYMDYITNKLCDINTSNINSLKLEIVNIINTLPFFQFQSNGDNFYIRYNSKTTIEFNESLKSIIREIKLNKILQ